MLLRPSFRHWNIVLFFIIGFFLIKRGKESLILHEQLCCRQITESLSSDLCWISPWSSWSYGKFFGRVPFCLCVVVVIIWRRGYGTCIHRRNQGGFKRMSWPRKSLELIMLLFHFSWKGLGGEERSTCKTGIDRERRKKVLTKTPIDRKKILISGKIHIQTEIIQKNNGSRKKRETKDLLNLRPRHDRDMNAETTQERQRGNTSS